MNAWRRPRHAFLQTPARSFLSGLALMLCLMGAPRASHAAAASDGTNASDSNADSVSFDRNLLSGGGSHTDTLARFEQGTMILPGRYDVDLYVNNVPVGRSVVRFAARPGHRGEVDACMSLPLLSLTRLQPELTPGVRANLVDPARCVLIGDLLKGAQAQFDMGELRLDIGVPQASMSMLPRGYVSPDNFSQGVNAGLLNYSFNGYRIRSQGLSRTSAYLNLDAGVNLGRWRFRHRSALTWQGAAGAARARHDWQNIETYARRELPALDAQLTIGDSYTSGELFDSVALRGVQLATDERMLPSSQRGYAPVVRGVARTNAKVTIRQNGVVIYQTTVAPGPFAIHDLYPTGYGGDLEVEIGEADGSVRAFIVPYASVAQLLRPGSTYFQLVSGQLRNPALIHRQRITEGTLRHGFSNLVTGYAGTVGARGYFAWVVGSALNTRMGALSVDATTARTKIPGVATFKGRSYRLAYSKILPVTDTSISVAAYRYSTHGYLGLNDAMLARDYARRGLQVFATGPQVVNGTDLVPIPGVQTPATNSTTNLYTGGIDRPRSRFSLTLNQHLGMSAGSLFLNAWTRDYWNRPQHDTQFQVGYHNHIHSIGFNVTATRSRDALGHNDNQIFASINIPLGDDAHAPTLTANIAHDGQQNWQQQLTVNGTAGHDNQYYYGATTSHDGASRNTSMSLNGGYRGPFTMVHASAGKGRDYTQSSLSVSGSVVAHPGGVTFGQPVGGTIGIIVARHARGAHVTNAAGARVDGHGYAIVPFLTPYTYNNVGLDPRGLSLNVQLDATSTRVAPRAGAVVMIPFKTRYGRSLIVRGRQGDGEPLPFGAQADGVDGRALGIVGQGGRMLVRGISGHGRIRVHWTDPAGATHVCGFSYTVPDAASNQAYPMIDTVCRPSTPAHGGQS